MLSNTQIAIVSTSVVVVAAAALAMRKSSSSAPSEDTIRKWIKQSIADQVPDAVLKSMRDLPAPNAPHVPHVPHTPHERADRFRDEGGVLALHADPDHTGLRLAHEAQSVVVARDIVLSTSGLEALRVASSGHVGIGVPAPRSALDVSGDISFTGELLHNGVPFATGCAWTSADGVATYAGSIGVGGSVRAANLTHMNWNSAAMGVRGDGGDKARCWKIATLNSSSGQAYGVLTIRGTLGGWVTGQSDAMTIDVSMSVRGGVAVSGTIRSTNYLTAAGVMDVVYVNNTLAHAYDVYLVVKQAEAYYTFDLDVGASGNTTLADPCAAVAGAPVSGTSVTAACIHSGATQGGVLIQNGCVGIGTDHPRAPLHVHSEARSKAVSDGDWGGLESRNANFVQDSTDVAVSAQFSHFVMSNTGFLVWSDERIKKDIRTIGAHEALETVKRLRPVTFQHRDEQYGRATFTGFVAQEVQRVYPSAVTRHNGCIASVCAARAATVVADGLLLKEPLDVPDGARVQLRSAERWGQFEMTHHALTGGSMLTGDCALDDEVARTGSVYVYGHHDETLTVDREALFTLALASIQALARRVEELERERVRK